MNWEVITAVAEVTGALAVVASLIYLARQVRENTRASRSATRQAVVDSIIAVNMIVPQNEQFSRVFRNHVDGAELQNHEKFQITGWAYAYLRTWENVHFQYRTGLLSDEDWQCFRHNVKAILQLPAVEDFWRRERDVFSQAFRREVGSLLDEIPEQPILKDALIFQKSTEAET